MDLEARADETQRSDEDALLVAVARGDIEALRRLYRAFERPLYSLGIRWLGDPKSAEEMVQEVTLRMWRRASRYDPTRGAASSWIFGIARNVAADIARANRRLPTPMEEPRIDRAEPWDEDGVWTGWQVARALRTLPAEQQIVLELAYGNEMTQSEIAEHLDVPLGTVKTRTYAGLKKLRAALTALGILEVERERPGTVERERPGVEEQA